MCKIISIANQKGGVGKTTTAMNLGVALELQGKHTLLIDFDPQASLSSYLGFINDNGDNIDELPTINNLMMSENKWRISCHQNKTAWGPDF